MSIILKNTAHFSDMALFSFMVESDIMLVTIFNVIVTVSATAFIDPAFFPLKIRKIRNITYFKQMFRCYDTICDISKKALKFSKYISI